MNLLLDTCAFLWFITNDKIIPSQIDEHIRDPDNDVYLSSVSLWEMIVKCQTGKFNLPQAPELFIPEQRKRHEVSDLPLDENSIVHLVKLPSHHRDPFDRMLICQALENNLTIVTPDKAIRDYPIRTIW